LARYQRGLSVLAMVVDLERWEGEGTEACRQVHLMLTTMDQTDEAFRQHAATTLRAEEARVADLLDGMIADADRWIHQFAPGWFWALPLSVEGEEMTVKDFLQGDVLT